LHLLAAMLLRGLGHQNDGDSLAARRGRESENTSISVLLHRRVSHSVSFPWCSLYPIPNGASLYPPLSFSHSKLTSFSCPPSHFEFCSCPYLPLFFPCVSQIPSFYLAPSISPPQVKLGLFFIIPHVCRTCSESSDYATLCVSCCRATWNLFREFDVLDIATSAMEKRRICDTILRLYEKEV